MPAGRAGWGRGWWLQGPFPSRILAVCLPQSLLLVNRALGARDNREEEHDSPLADADAARSRHGGSGEHSTLSGIAPLCPAPSAASPLRSPWFRSPPRMKCQDSALHQDQSPQFLSPAGKAKQYHPSRGLVVTAGRSRIKMPAKSLKRVGFNSTSVPGVFAVGFSSGFWVGLLVFINPSGCLRAVPAPDQLSGTVPWREGCQRSGCRRALARQLQGVGLVLAARPWRLLPSLETPVCSLNVTSRVTCRKVFYLYPVLC
ncbi:uncharacterized protein LOC121233111 isoform X1 [Aquila chrysaetos chrysaetos]|uniref:uncharacterized protein LOC121233111 isoform X1 n=1 Tax=Aquila chrysaetos chrysaetos TaxID=223781 RepID=UPI001B7D3B09|nr:uncharacterized protein LOC121233111 isoform X1 [Aquila chrysaetos chrysaetos]